MYDFNKHFNRRGTNCWKWDGEGRDVRIAMGCADTDFRIAEPIVSALHSKIDEGALTYPVDNDHTREALRGYWKRHFNADVQTDWICDSVGMMNGLRLTLEALTHVGDSVIVQSPVFNYFNDTVESSGRHILDNRLIYDRGAGRYQIDFEQLQEMAQQSTAVMMLISNPVNPLSRAYTREELARISRICADNQVILISDEVHGDFYYDGLEHVSLLSLPEELRDLCIVMTAPGKTFNTHGLYTAFHIIPDGKMRKAYMREYKDRHMDYMDLGMVAAAAAYSECDEYVKEMREYITNNLQYVKSFLQERQIGVKLPVIEATYLLWLDFLDWNKSSGEIGKILNEYGLSLSNGAQYGPGGDGFMRMDIATQLDTVKEGLLIIEKAYNERIRR